MAARYATQSFTIQLPSGASMLIMRGALRDSLHAAVTGNPGAWSTVPPVAGPDVTGVMAGYLAAYPSP